MKLSPDAIKLKNLPEVSNRIIQSIESYVDRAETEGVVFGLSGGVDSSTVAVMCVRAVGPERCLGLILPDERTNPQDVNDAMKLAGDHGIPYERIEISPQVKSFYNTCDHFNSEDLNAVGNVTVRVRALVLYLHANMMKRLVVGSSDKSELLLGYFTKYGDGAADLYPLASLYKSQVRMVAKHLGILERITLKPPSPGLWPGITAEKELGAEYAMLDLILYGMEHGMQPEEISEQIEAPIDLVRKVFIRHSSTAHKRMGIAPLE